LDTKKYCCYVYSFDVLFSDKIEAVFFKAQTLRLRTSDTFEKVPQNDQDESLWKITANVNVDENLKPKTSVTGAAEALRDFVRYSPFGDSVGRPSRWCRRIEQHINSANPTQLGLPLVLYGALTHVIVEDMVGGETYNIIPSRAKEPEDCAKAPGVEKDGGGLAATLYALTRKGTMLMSGQWGFYPWHHPRRLVNANISVEKLLDYVRLANESIASINVNNDPYSNQLKVTLRIENGGYSASLPLSAMSDGTIKWLAMITAILTARSVFSIEEPENYLHPLMQGQILKIMRDVLLRKRQSFALVTTHSETILNSSRPEELVVVSLAEGRTRARRCSNAAQLKKEISETGFGLGYYYLGGAVEDA
jgi:hypothetical protein